MNGRKCPVCGFVMRQEGASPVVTDWMCFICGFWGRLRIADEQWIETKRKPITRKVKIDHPVDK